MSALFRPLRTESTRAGSTGIDVVPEGGCEAGGRRDSSSSSSCDREDTSGSESALLGYLARFRQAAPVSAISGNSIDASKSTASHPLVAQGQTGWGALPRLLRNERSDSKADPALKEVKDCQPHKFSLGCGNHHEDVKPLLGTSDDLEAAMRQDTQNHNAQRRRTLFCSILLGSLIGILLPVVSLGLSASGKLRNVSAKADRQRKQPLPSSFPPIIASGPAELSFYMYRAQSDVEYALQNVNAADLPGVMWYLHNEIVVSVPRKYDVTRILRFKVTMRNTQALFNSTHSNFGPFVAFDAAECTVPGCQELFGKYGYVVGCQNLDPNLHRYTSPSTHKPGAWYSLPGPCPSAPNGAKSRQCLEHMPGGACQSVYDLHVPPERQICTYHTEPAGEIRLDDLVGIPDYPQFRAGGNSEYDVVADKGRGTSFWNGKHDQEKCDMRIERLQDLFQKKYPNVPINMDEPLCD